LCWSATQLEWIPRSPIPFQHKASAPTIRRGFFLIALAGVAMQLLAVNGSGAPAGQALG
jgi:hypothetical protein